jgi:SAM-dependent methyltransferase
MRLPPDVPWPAWRARAPPAGAGESTGTFAFVVNAQRAQVFGAAADVYDQSRPGYPQEAVDLIVADHPSTAIDVGCGTGKAARLVMDRGVDVIGVELDERMAAVARRHGVNVVCARFEDWPASTSDCVFSAQAWHWIDPAVGAAKVASVLSQGGRWVAMWNREDDAVVTEALVDEYRRFAPHLADERLDATAREQVMVDGIAAAFAAADTFEPLQRHVVTWTDALTVSQLVSRWSTNSGHRLLPARVADELHGGLTTALAVQLVSSTFRTPRLCW